MGAMDGWMGRLRASLLITWPRLCCRCVCAVGDIAPETAALLTEHGVDHGDFPASVLQDLRDLGG